MRFANITFTVAGLIAAGVLAIYMLVDVALDPAACFGSCS